MAKSKVKQKGAGFVIEGLLNYDKENPNKVVEVEELGEYPFDKIFEQFNGKLIKITIDIPDVDIVVIPEE